MSSSPKLAPLVPDISAEEIAAHFNLLPERYFTQTDEADIALHIGMVNRLLQTISNADSLGTLRPVIEWRDNATKTGSTVHIVTWDRAGLFYMLAGALSVAGLNIHTARISTRNDHIAIDTFEVASPSTGVVSDVRVRELFAKTVEEALMGGRDLANAINSQASRFAHGETFSPPPGIELYLEISSPRVILEIHAADRFGLLYRVGRIIAEEGFNLSAARVATERGLALDSFYLEAADKRPVDTARLQLLREALRAALAAT